MILRDRPALVTGAARGIGLAIARRFAAEGARVALLDVDGPGAEGAARAVGAGAIWLAADVTRSAEVDAAADEWSQVLAVDLTSVLYCP